MVEAPRTEALPQTVAAMLQEARDLLEQHPQAAGVLSQEAYRLAQKGKDEHSLAEALLLMGITLQKRSDLEAARTALLDAAGRFGKLGDRRKEQQAWAQAGRVCLDLGQIEDAEGILKQSLRLAEELADSKAKAETLSYFAGVLYAQEQYTRALEISQQVLEAQRGLSSLQGEIEALGILVMVYAKLGEYSKALAAQLEAFQRVQMGELDARKKAQYLINIGVLYHETKDYAKALDYLQQALKLTQEHSLHTLQATAFTNAGFASAFAGDLSGAQQYFQKGLSLAQQIGFKVGEASALDGLAQLYMRKQDLVAAKGAHQLALKSAAEVGQGDLEVSSLLSLSRLALGQAQPSEALIHLEKALGRAQESGDKKSIYQAHELLAQTHEKLSNYRKALGHYQAYYKLHSEVLKEETQRQILSQTRKLEHEQARSKELEMAQQEVVECLAKAANYRDGEPSEHGKRVSDYAARIAKLLGWSEERIVLLRLAALLHDVGKVGIADAILLKPGKYTSAEHDLMRAHTEIGASILSGGHSRVIKIAEEIALTHHERWDGTGYPSKLTGMKIPESGRIVAVAEVLDALTSNRPYRMAWPLDKALGEIRQQSGKQFDPKVVEACLKAFEEKGK